MTYLAVAYVVGCLIWTFIKYVVLGLEPPEASQDDRD